ncbi:protein-disulfide reductase DsbD family protein [Salidesulfovibrio onnuriiensis]|uniref:protein-disulfide reductase DsbD family protein n=1 Tax=Salidesulfovibrio onnuriiensis TaxID=2583823 RepID=UPI0011CCC9E4|nr:cytochrome c biogenesis protein CcdA [Salidesulfovibrio onnuriiensis]
MSLFLKLSKKSVYFILVALLFLHSWTGLASAQFHAQELPLKTAWKLYTLDPAKGNSGNLLAVLTVTFEDGWHTYAHTPGDLGKPTILRVQTTDGLPLSVQYPTAISTSDTLNPQAMVNIYEGEVRFYIPIPENTDDSFTLLAELQMLLCSDTQCMPARIELPFKSNPEAPQPLSRAEDQPWWPDYLQSNSEASSATSTQQSAPHQTRIEGIQWDFTPSYAQPALEVDGLLTAILLGLLAGLILNAMPCVLPVISLKLGSVLAGCAHEDEHERQRVFRTHNILFSLGIMTWFVILALVLGVTGQAWGEIFQQSWMIMVLTAVVFALSLSLFGLYSLPIIDLKFDQETRNPKMQAYFTGLLATLLATPCSGPFLGGVLGWALTRPPLVIVSVFLSIGLGMALPYLTLTVFPSLVRFLPRPGPWVQAVEKVVAFFLAGTCIYLINILPDSRLIPMLLLLWLTVPAAWLWGKAGPALPGMKRWGLRLAGLFLFVIALCWALTPKDNEVHWQKFQAHELAEQLGKTTMLIDFTADWCPTCKVIERTVLTPDNLAEWKHKYDVAFIRVDLTEDNPEGERLLHALGSKSIPVAALFSAGEDAHKPVVLRDVFTASQLENLLESYKK